MLARKFIATTGDPLVPTSVTLVGHNHGDATAAPPAHQVGDMLVVLASRFGSTVGPTTPAGWEEVRRNGSGGSLNVARLIAYKIATSTSETADCTNASIVTRVVLRAVNGTDPAGSNNIGLSTNISIAPYGMGVLDVQDGSSFLMSAAHAEASGRTFSMPSSLGWTAGTTSTVGSFSGFFGYKAGLVKAGASANGGWAPTASGQHQAIGFEVLS